MKQTIRLETFETNSSSYHSVSIHRKGYRKEEEPLEFEIGKPVTLDGRIKYKTIGGTDSYTFTSRTKLDKTNMLLRYIDDKIEDWVCEQPEYEAMDRTKLEYRGIRETKRRISLNCPLIVALKELIEEYIQAEVTFRFSENWNDYFDSVYPEDLSVYDIFKLDDAGLEDITKLKEAYRDIIFNDEIEITEECESN